MTQEQKKKPMVIKSYTDMDQSKKLAEILPLESADMYYSPVPVREWKDKTDTSKGTHVVFKNQIFAIENLPNREIGEGDVYAWSLVALLNVLEFPSLTQNKEDEWEVCVPNCESDEYIEVSAVNPIDACVSMIIKLNKFKML